MWRVVLTLLVASVLAGCGSQAQEGPPEADREAAERFDAERAFDDLVAQVEIGPRPAGSEASRETADLIADRLRESGVSDVAIQDPHLNVVGHIPGAEDGAVVVGAHHDTKDDAGDDFEGANDGASGVAVVLELARALGSTVEGPSIHLALFDAEETRGHRPFAEDGMRGSRQYVRYARRGGVGGSPPLSEIRAMVLFDMVGDCDLEVPREANSDPELYALFADAARELSDDDSAFPFEGQTGPILDDHIPFIRAGIAAVNLIDFDYGPGPSPGAWWHTEEDSLDKVCSESLGAVGAPAALAVERIR